VMGETAHARRHHGWGPPLDTWVHGRSRRWRVESYLRGVKRWRDICHRVRVGRAHHSRVWRPGVRLAWWESSGRAAKLTGHHGGANNAHASLHLLV